MIEAVTIINSSWNWCSIIEQKTENGSSKVFEFEVFHDIDYFIGLAMQIHGMNGISNAISDLVSDQKLRNKIETGRQQLEVVLRFRFSE